MITSSFFTDGRSASFDHVPRAMHREADPFVLRIHTHDVDNNHFADTQVLVGMPTPRTEDFGNVHQPIMANAKVDECAELGEVGDPAPQFHAGLKFFESPDVVIPDRYQFTARIRADVGEKVQDIEQPSPIMTERHQRLQVDVPR